MFTHVLQWPAQLKLAFNLWLCEGRTEQLPLRDKTLTCLLIFSAFCWALAGVLFLTQGYHVGFFTINSWSSTLSPGLLDHITTFGDGTFMLSLALLIAHRKVSLLYCILIASLISGIISNALKNIIDAGRPPSFYSTDMYTLVGQALKIKSFPSGHTTTAFLCASIFILFTDKLWIRILLILMATLVGFSRIWVGVHWPIDILAGAGLGTLVGVISYRICLQRQKKISARAILFALVVMLLASFIGLFENYEYLQAQWLVSLIAIVSLWKFCQFFLIPKWPNTLKLSDELTIFNRRWHYSDLLFFSILTVLTIYRILILYQNHLTLFYDEAYYYHWSLNLDFGYYSKPPMVAWIIALSTAIFSTSTETIKLFSPLLYSASAAFVFLTCRRIHSSESGLVAGLLILVAPLVGFNSAFMTTDAPLFLFWSLSVYLFVRCLSTTNPLIWAALGLSCGLGMLSKYTMALLPASLFVFLLINQQHRALLTTYRPWLAALIAGLVFSLNLWWNSEHQWVAFAHTSEISHQDKPSFNITHLIEFLAGQIFVLGPVTTWLLWRSRKQIALLFQQAHTRTYAQMFTCVALGILAVISVQALSSRAQVNWAAPWIITTAALIGLASAQNTNFSRTIRTACVVQLLLLSTFYHWPHIQSYLRMQPSKTNTPYQRILGWQEMAEQLQPIIAQHPNAVLASDSRDLLAYLGYHALQGQDRLYRWNENVNNVRDHYDLKYNLRDLAGKQQELIYVSRHPLAQEKLDRFETVKFVGELQQHVFYDLQHHIYVYIVKGFKGYE